MLCDHGYVYTAECLTSIHGDATCCFSQRGSLLALSLPAPASTGCACFLSPALSALKMAGSKPPEHYPKELVDSVQAIIDSCKDEKDRKAILVRFQTIVTVLTEAKILTVRKMKATDILPHPANRGGERLQRARERGGHFSRGLQLEGVAQLHVLRVVAPPRGEEETD